jgi:phage tail sheath protein FI
MANFVGTIITRTTAGPLATGSDPGDSIFIAVQAERGLEDTVHEFTSYARFRQIFGGEAGTPIGSDTRITEADEVLNIMYSKGRARKRCFAVRCVDSSAVQAYVDIVDAEAADTLRIHAKGSGTWANVYEATISSATRNGYIPIADYVSTTIYADAATLQGTWAAASNDEKYGWATLDGVTTLYLSDGAAWVSQGKTPSQVASFKIEVKATASGTVIETFDNLSMTEASLESVGNQSDFIYLENLDSASVSPFNAPDSADYLLGADQAGVDGNEPLAADIVGTDDGLGAKTGLKAFRDKKYGRGFLIAPGLDSNATVRSEMEGHLDSFSRVTLLGAPAGLTVTTVQSDVPDLLAAYYWPLPRVQDALTDELKPISPVGHVLAQWFDFISDEDYGKHPAGKDFKVDRVHSFETQSNGADLVDEAIAETLVGAGINPVYDKGSGPKIWGARTCSSDPNWAYIHSLWDFCVISDRFQRFLDDQVYENASAGSFFSDLEESLRISMADLNSKGMFDGTTPSSKEAEDFEVHGFNVQANRDLLTPSDLATNTIRIRCWFKDSLTAETIRAEIAKRAPTA